MDEAKIRTALDHCMALSKASQRRISVAAQYLESLRDDHAWTPEERAELQRRVITGLVEVHDEGEVL